MKLLLCLIKSFFNSLASLPEKFIDLTAPIIHDACVTIYTEKITGIIKNLFSKNKNEVHIIDMQKSAGDFIHYITNGELQNNEIMQQYLNNMPSFETEVEVSITAKEIKYKKRVKGNIIP